MENIKIKDLKGNVIYKLELETLKGAKLTYMDLSNADLSNLDLTGTDFSNSLLKGANLSHSILCNANLAYIKGGHINLSYADLTDTNLEGANLSYSNLSYAKNIKTNATYLHEANTENATFAEESKTAEMTATEERQYHNIDFDFKNGTYTIDAEREPIVIGDKVYSEGWVTKVGNEWYDLHINHIDSKGNKLCPTQYFAEVHRWIDCVERIDDEHFVEKTYHLMRVVEDENGEIKVVEVTD